MLPVRIRGLDRDGKPFIETVLTVDLSHQGARLEGLASKPKANEVVVLQRDNKESRFRVMWVGEPGTTRAGQIALQALEAHAAFWGVALPAPHPDTFAEATRPTAAPQPPPLPQDQVQAADVAFANAVSHRLRKIAMELQQVEQILQAGLVDPEVLRQFRDSVNHTRQTGWVVQQFVEAQANRQTSVNVNRLILDERLRVATDICKKLAQDLSSRSEEAVPSSLKTLTDAVEELSAALRASVRS